MANPQPDRYVRISNELLEAIYRAPLTLRMHKILLWVIRNSYGWNRKWAPAKSMRDIGGEMEMDFSNVATAVRGLIRAGVLKKEGDRFYLVKDYEKWAVDSGDNSVNNGRGRIDHVAKSTTDPWPNRPRSVAKSTTDINKVVKDRIKDRKTSSRANNARDPNVKLLVDEFFVALEHRLKEKPVGFNGGAAAKGFKKLLGYFPRHEIQSRFNAWFGSTDPHIERRGWRVEDFFSNFNRLKDGPMHARTIERRSQEDRDREFEAARQKAREDNARIKARMDAGR